MEPLLFGLETEYAIGTVDARGAPLERANVAAAIIARAQDVYPHLPDETMRGMFLPSGARFYLDAGQHLEMSTPECDNPWDVVRYTLAGHRIVTALARGVDAQRRGARTTVFRSNVCYASGASFGSHESYGHRVAPSEMAAQITPHLASRVIYTGAGGFRTGSAGIEFMLSPRAAHITHDASPDSTRDRGLIHTKDEPLRDGDYNRLHLICGETTCSELSGWLRVGTTALIVALVNSGERPGTAVQLAQPASALRAFASEPRSVVSGSFGAGRQLTALAIQRHYLAAVEAHLSDGRLPTWAPAVCASWRTVLDDCESQSSRTGTRLDWAIKLSLLQQRSAARGVPWSAWPVWTRIIARLHAAWSRLPDRAVPFNLDAAMSPTGPIASEIGRLTPALREAGLQWRDLPQVMAMRDELLEIDLRFGQLDDHGIFNRLDAAGALDHHVDGIDRIEAAEHEPPAVARVRRRAALVRQLSSAAPRYSCDWVSVKDHQEQRIIDLDDPSPDATWKPADLDMLRAARAGLLFGRRPRATAARETQR